MNLSQLYALLSPYLPAANDYEVFLAAPDTAPGDSVEVLLDAVGWIDVDYEANDVRIYPASAASEERPSDELFSLEALIGNLPLDTKEDESPHLRVELPLIRDGGGYIHKSMGEIYGIHFGTKEGVVWLLTRPKSEFQNDDLPA